MRRIGRADVDLILADKAEFSVLHDVAFSLHDVFQYREGRAFSSDVIFSGRAKGNTDQRGGKGKGFIGDQESSVFRQNCIPHFLNCFEYGFFSI